MKVLSLGTAFVMTLSMMMRAEGKEKIADTQKNRLLQANRVLAAQPIEETLEGMIKEVSKGKTQTEADAMRQAIQRSDTSILTDTFREAYANTFTADELAFLADYSVSDTGKRVQEKMPRYVSQITPVLQDFVKHAFGQGGDSGSSGQQTIGGGSSAKKTSGRQKKSAAQEF